MRMLKNADINIEFDDISKEYYVIWEPPVAIGSGNTELDALRDLQEVVHFSVDSLLTSMREKTHNADGDKETNTIENQEKIREKARKIVALLPRQNCGKCGFNNCGEFAMAVAQGEIAPYGCRKQPSLGYRISEITGIEVSKREIGQDYGTMFPHSEISGKRHHGIKDRRGKHSHKEHYHHHHHGHGRGKGNGGHRSV